MKLALLLAFVTATALATEFSNVQEVAPNDSMETIVEKAAHVIPTPRQLEYHQSEFLCFIHFGPNTFTGREWGNGFEDPAVFAPKTVDTDQWCETIKAAGMTMVVMTFKHHDGYVLWQSSYEDRQTIKNSPYKNGKGDLAKQLSESCKKYGLKLGIYLSPADLYQIESKDGLYGNGSKYQKSIIPTDPDSFKTNPMKVRADKPADAPTFTIECDDYNRYMLNQLYEMLTEYGPIHEVWFDGAHPKSKGGQTYTSKAWNHLIRTLAPNAVITVKGPDVRWCGNEAGRTRESEWNVVPLDESPETIDWPDMRRADIGSRDKIKDAKFLYYWPAEVDTSIRHGWFWRNDTSQGVRTPDDIFDIYERSIGGNCTLLLNVPPNRDGKLSPRDVACLKEVGRRIKATYGTDLAAGGSVSAENLQDGDITTYWQPKGTTGEVTVTLPKKSSVNRFVIQEAIADRGQRIEKHALDAWVDGAWQEVATETIVGYKKIIRFPAVTTDKFRIRILESRLEPSIAEISAHFYNQPTLPIIATRDTDGKVSLVLDAPKSHGKSGGLTIRYTLDGTEPTRESTVFEEAIPFVNGGMIKARSFSKKDAGPVAELRFGPSKSQWKATASSIHETKFDASMAIDEDPRTLWHSSWHKPTKGHPHTLTIDFGMEHAVTAITYLPRQDRAIPDGMIEQGRVELSKDGKTWTDAGTFTFGNLVNDPAERTFPLESMQKASYLRITSLKGAANKPYAAAAEIGILTEE